jgi:DNA-binding MarR family transcriptional regulator
MEFLRVMMSLKMVLLDIAEQHGLTFQQALVLHTLHTNGSLLMGVVADKMHCDASNITGIIDRLVQQGLVTRQELAQDRRAKQLALTAKGSAFIEEVMREVPQAVGFESLTAAERTQLAGYLQKLGSVVR